MDEKDKNEAANNEADNSSEKITVNVTSSDDNVVAEPKEEVKPEEKNDELDEKGLEDMGKAAEESQDNAKIEDSTEEVKEEPVIEETVTTETETVPAPEAEPVPAEEPATDTAKMDSGPDLIPSVQPAQSASVSPPTEVAQLKKRNKKLKVWLVIFVILLVGIASAAVVYFNQQSKSSDTEAALQAENAKLQQQLVEQQQNATQKSIDDLNKQLEEAQKANADLTQQNKDLEAFITELTTVATELKDTCGTACDDIEIPTVEATTPAQ